MISLAEKTFGRVDVLVNNAGIQHVSPIEEFPVEKWDAIIAINLSSAFHAIRAAVPGMKQRGWGRVINTASAHSLVASPFKSAYVAAEHGIAGLTKTVALELARSKITCNCISPGYVWTPLVEKQNPETMKARNMSEDQVSRTSCWQPNQQRNLLRSNRWLRSHCFCAVMTPPRSLVPILPWMAAGRLRKVASRIDHRHSPVGGSMSPVGTNRTNRTGMGCPLFGEDRK
jgi:3-hydroxybutyrate dehydrogenase